MVSENPNLAERFLSRFSGNTRVHGQYTVDKTQDNGKKVGQAVTRPEPVTIELWEKHLSGEQRLGVVPIRDDNTCVFGAIDIDSYKDFDVAALAAKVTKLGFPLVVCKSKSGGAHCYLFSKEPRAAKDYRARLGEMAKALGCKADVELFPKQVQMSAERKDMGSWINMPYFEGARSMVYTIRGDGTGLTLTQFLDYADLMAVDDSFFDEPLQVAGESEFFPEGPPCLQSLVNIAVPSGSRNDGFYSVCVYLRQAFPSDWKTRAKEYSRRFFDPPMTEDDGVSDTIRGVARSHPHRYPCKKSPIKERCESAICRGRRYGVGHNMENSVGEDGKRRANPDGASVEDNPEFPVLGKLKKLDTDPPLWFLEVNDSVVELTTEQLQSPRLFQGRCMECAGIMPPLASAKAWQKLINEKIATCIPIPVPEECLPDALYMAKVCFFCTQKKNTDRETILSGSAFLHDGHYWFLFAKLQQSLHMGVKHAGGVLPPSKQMSILKSRGLKTDTWEIRGQQTPVVGLPESEVPTPAPRTPLPEDRIF